MKRNIKIIYSWKVSSFIFPISALLVLSLYGLPHALYYFELPEPGWMAYSGPPDEEFYLTLVEEVYRGGTAASGADLVSPFLGGYNGPPGSPLPAFTIYLAGWFQRILQLSPKTLVTLLDLVLPLATFYLIFALARRIGLGLKSSLLASFIAVSTPFIFFGEPAIPSRIFLLPKGRIFDFYLPLSRVINPQMGILFFIGALALWVGVGSRHASPLQTIGCLALSALCMASNLYMGTALIAFWGSELLVEVFSRRRWGNIATSALACATTSAPLVLQWREVERLIKIFPNMYLLDLLGSRLPLVTKGEIVAIALLSLHILLRRRSLYDNYRDRFVVLSVLAYIASLNQQIVTGRMVNSWHYEYYVFNFILPIIVAAVVAEWRESKSFPAVDLILGRRRLSAIFFFVGLLILIVGFAGGGRIYPLAPYGVKEVAQMFKVICVIIGALCLFSGCILFFGRKGSIGPGPLLFILLMVFSFGDGMVEQLFGYEVTKNWQIKMEKEYKSPFQWMNFHLTSSNVFLGFPFPTRSFPSDVTSYIPIYTGQKVFLSSASTMYPIPGLQDSRKRQLIIFALMGMNEGEFLANVIENKGIFHGLFFRKSNYENRSVKAMLFDAGRIPPLTHQELLDTLRQYEYYRKHSIEELFRLERIDYLYWGPSEKYHFITIAPQKLGFLEKVFSENDVEIYRIKNR